MKSLLKSFKITLTECHSVPKHLAHVCLTFFFASLVRSRDLWCEHLRTTCVMSHHEFLFDHFSFIIFLLSLLIIICHYYSSIIFSFIFFYLVSRWPALAQVAQKRSPLRLGWWGWVEAFCSYILGNAPKGLYKISIPSKSWSATSLQNG